MVIWYANNYSVVAVVVIVVVFNTTFVCVATGLSKSDK